MAMTVLKVLLTVLLTGGGFTIGFWQTHLLNAGMRGAVAGLGIAGGVLFIEWGLRKISPRLITAGILGGLLGLFLANLLTRSALFALYQNYPELLYVQSALAALFVILGIMLGVKHLPYLTMSSIRAWFAEPTATQNYKILDTSVIIDGRIADISETGFLEGVLIIPQFILKELQHIADSSDSLKRNRGRRGLEILHKIQKRVDMQVEIVEKDFPKIKEIDAKLVELGKFLQAKLITNDFNLNKVAELQGVSVLNVNELANAVKPVVLPGEVIEVLVLKEGKEYDQGIAYLDDGTMIVIDHAKRLIGKTVNVSVTSVLQTTAGRMIFGQVETKDVMAK